MSDKKWKPGDLVRLKSGGPVMTVQKSDTLTQAEGHNNVWCTWFPTAAGYALATASAGGWSARSESCAYHEDALEKAGVA